MPPRPARLGPPRLIRIDLAPVHVSTVADLDGLDYVAGLVVTHREDTILLTAAGWEGHFVCDLFAINPSGQNFRMIQPRFGCTLLGMSPDGTKVSASSQSAIRIVDLETAVAESLVGEFLKGVWSPDGRWIATVESSPRNGPGLSRTILVDAEEPSRRRDIGGEVGHDAIWSPDSRHLLYSEWSARCPGHSPIDPGPTPLTLFITHVETGERSEVSESRCKVNAYLKLGWVSLDVVKGLDTKTQ